MELSRGIPPGVTTFAGNGCATGFRTLDLLRKDNGIKFFQSRR
jgi:hypothetical protein